ncbi:hypothetical protein PIB30_008479, partial [Stylosanthes scabra]|nr:hypothetical protein [Stylosanthes scabra]
WLNGNNDWCWESRFLRNKTASKKSILNGVEVIFKQEKDFKARVQWLEKEKSIDGRWIQWE